MNHRFYVNKSDINLDNMLLPKEVIHHINVLRIKVHQTIEIFDGEGAVYIFLITKIDKKNIIVELINSYQVEPITKPRLHLAVAIIQNDKLDLILQKAVELGVNIITPIITNRTQMQNIAKLDKKLNHWHKIIQNSAAQCRADILPQINNITNINDFILNVDKLNSLNYILSVSLSNTFFTKKNISNDTMITILIGPEGGYTNQEEEFALNNNFTPLHMGDLVLRTETAAISAICTMNILYRDFIKGILF